MTDIKSSQFHLYRYQISDISLVSAAWKNPLIISKSLISNVTIVNPYGRTIIPEISIDCEVSYDIYYEILAQKDIRAKFNIIRSDIGLVTKENIKSNETNIIGSKWINCDLKVNDKGFIYSNDVSESSLDTADASNRDHTKRIKLLLYDYDSLLKYRQCKSVIIDGTVNDVIYHLLSERDFDNFIVSSSENNTDSNFAIPYGDLGSNLETLNSIYGIYSYRYMLFLGLDRNYLLNYNNIGKDLETGELSTVSVMLDRKDSDQEYSGSYEDASSFIVKSRIAKINNSDYMVDFSDGGKIICSIFGSDKKSEETIGYYPVEKAYLVNNEYAEKQIKNKIASSKRSLSITLRDIDFKNITPNKRYKVSADARYFSSDYDISGDYYLSSSVFVLTNTGNGIFQSTTNITLCKKE